jgi:putative ABC transport system permease protein
MKTPLAWLNLVHSKTRTMVAVAGVAFAVVLIFMQLGFLGAAEKTAELIYNSLDFQVLIRSRQYRRLASSGTIPEARLYSAASTPEVARVYPLRLLSGKWRNPFTFRKRTILTIGVRPEDSVFLVPELCKKTRLLTDPEFVLIDRLARSEFGPRNGRSFGDEDLGSETEVNQHRVQVVGHFALGGGFEADGVLLVNQRGFQRLHSAAKPDQVNLGLVQLQPGADAEAVADRLRRNLPDDVEIFTRPAVIARERRIWVEEMAIGVIFRMGVGVALVVGMAIVYQVLSSDVANHLPEYATLKAVGYGDRFLAKVVLQEAVILALFGFLPGLAVSQLLYLLTNQMTRLPIEMSLARVALVLGLSVLMCTVSGLGALRKVHQADPADLF